VLNKVLNWGEIINIHLLCVSLKWTSVFKIQATLKQTHFFTFVPRSHGGMSTLFPTTQLYKATVDLFLNIVFNIASGNEHMLACKRLKVKAGKHTAQHISSNSVYLRQCRQLIYEKIWIKYDSLMVWSTWNV